MKLIIIPLKNHKDDFILIINSVFADIEQKKELQNFTILKESKKGISRAITDSIILQPNVMGMGINFNKIIDFFKK